MTRPNPDETPRSQTSAPVKPPRTTEEVFPRQDDAEREPGRKAGDDEAVRGDRMPRGADEPGAGL